MSVCPPLRYACAARWGRLYARASLRQVRCQPHVEPNMTTNTYDITGIDGSIELVTASAMGDIRRFDCLHAIDFQRSGSHLGDAELSMLPHVP